jgi:uncharacterized CHY-type Zn-finger protein
MKYVFKRLDGVEDRVLLCPKCRESIYRSDIEHFNSCPYCGSLLEMTDELEDFLLEPIVEGWTATEHRRMM